MKGRFRPSMAWLHTWSGLVVGWVLLAIFVTGTASYYRADITGWMRPELAQSPAVASADLPAVAERAVAYLEAKAPDALGWFIGLPHAERPLLELFWRNGPGEPPGHAMLDPKTGTEAAVRGTMGGDFLYRFHFELHMPPLWGRWIVGVCAMIMLVALISGIVTHKRIFADFFTFRRDKAARRSVLDAHNVAGVLALPFHLMITYTGIVTLSLMYMPWGVTAAYQGDSQTYFAETGQITASRPPAGRPAALAPIGPMVERALATVPETLEGLSIADRGDAHATVVAVFEEPRGLSHEHPQIAFDGVTGAVIELRSGGLKPAAKTFTTMVGLHEAHFAGPTLRLLFFLCGIMGSAMVATGLVLWTLARLPKPGEAPFLGLRLVRALNLAAVAGLPGGIAVYFLANRLLPADLAGRSGWEIRAFFAAWIAVALVGLVRPHRRAWSEGLAAVAALGLAVVVADVATIEDHPLRRPGEGAGLFLWFDGATLALAALFALAARKVARYQTPSRSGRLREPLPALRPTRRQSAPVSERRAQAPIERERA